MADASPRKEPLVRLGTLRGFLPLSDSVSTRGQNLPSLIQSRSSASLRDVRAYLNQRKASVYDGDTDEEPDVERDGEIRADPRSGQSPARDKYGRLERKTSNANASDVLMTPQMRSLRLIGNSNPRYQWYVEYSIDLGTDPKRSGLKEQYTLGRNTILAKIN